MHYCKMLTSLVEHIDATPEDWGDSNFLDAGLHLYGPNKRRRVDSNMVAQLMAAANGEQAGTVHEVAANRGLGNSQRFGLVLHESDQCLFYSFRWDLQGSFVYTVFQPTLSIRKR